MYDLIFDVFPAKITVYAPYITLYLVVSLPITVYAPYMTLYLVISLPIILCMHRVWPYNWCFPCKQYRTYIVYKYGSGQHYYELLLQWPLVTFHLHALQRRKGLKAWRSKYFEGSCFYLLNSFQDRKAETSQLMGMIHEERTEAEAALAAIMPEEEQAKASCTLGGWSDL